MTAETQPAAKATMRLAKKLYRTQAIALAVEAVTAHKTVRVHWRHAGSGLYHELEISGRDAPRRADELAQIALERTIVVRKTR